MRAILTAAAVLALLYVLPVAAAAPTLKVSIVSDVTQVTIEPGDRANVGLNVTVEFKEYPCAPGTEAGVDLVPPVAPPDWFGADPHPDAATYAAPKETKPASLSIHVSEDAPGGAVGRFRLQPVVHYPSAGACGNVEPDVDAPEFSIEVRTPARSSSPAADGTGTQDGGTGAPGLGVGSLLLLALCALLFARRRQ